LFCVSFFCLFFLCLPFGCDSVESSFPYPGHPTNWFIRAGGSFGEDGNLSPGAPYLSMKFYPADVEIFHLDTVTWVFMGKEPHTVSFINHFTSSFDPLDPFFVPLRQPVGLGYFDNSTSNMVSSGLRAVGSQNYTLMFNQTGTFHYLCAIHPSMLAHLHVRDWSATLGKTPEDVLSDGNDQWTADSTYALGDFIKETNLLAPVPYTVDSDGYRTWTVWAGVSGQPSDSNVTGVGPISAFDFFPGNGVFNISEGDRIQFVNLDDIIHTLALQTNSTFIPFESGHYNLSYIPDSELNSTYAGGFMDYGLLVPRDSERNYKTITFTKEGIYYVFCTLHSDKGMYAQINVLPENESASNQTTTSTAKNPTSSTGGSSGMGGGGTGIHGGQSSTGGGGNTGPFGTGRGTGTGGNNGGGTGGNGERNSGPATAISHPVMMLVTSLLIGVVLMI